MTDALLHSLVSDHWDDSMVSSTAAPTSPEVFDGIESDGAGDSDSDRDAAPKRKKRGSARPTSSKRVKHSVGMRADEARRHDLRDIAERGGGGRVMFMFEKVSKSKMLEHGTETL